VIVDDELVDKLTAIAALDVLSALLEELDAKPTVGTASSSIIVTTPVLSAIVAPLLGLLIMTLNVSLSSSILSSTIPTSTVTDVLPAVIVAVPELFVKSVPSPAAVSSDVVQSM